MDKIVKTIATLIVGAALAVLGLTSIPAEPTVSAVASPNVQSAYLKWGRGVGLAQYAYRYPLIDATSTPCRIVNETGTSSWAYVGLQVTRGLPVATSFDISTTATAYASSSAPIVKGVSLGANATLDRTFFPVSGGALLSPGEEINVKLATTTAVPSGMTGYCSAILLVN